MIKRIVFYRKSWLMVNLVVPILSLCTAFILPLFLYWNQAMRIKWLYSKVQGIHAKPTHVVVEGVPGNVDILRLNPAPPSGDGDSGLPGLKLQHSSFIYRFIKFEYDFTKNTFFPVAFRAAMSQKELLEKYFNGISWAHHKDLLERYGPCQLEVPRKSFVRLLVDEVLNPFYLFQVFSMILWFWDGYQKYAYCIFVISAGSVIENLHETVGNINNLRKMAHYECPVVVSRRN
jgi:cation-transporting ATPase 13A3/4/5